MYNQNGSEIYRPLIEAFGMPCFETLNSKAAHDRKVLNV